MQSRPLALALVAAAAVCVAQASSQLYASPAQPEALALLSSDAAAPATEADVLLALERGWWDVAKLALRRMRERGEAVATLTGVRRDATHIRDQATDIINLMRVGANAEETAVSTAFQWAQRADAVLLNVKFSSRIDGPVTCLNVDNEQVSFTNETLLFEAVGRQKPKTFRLNLTFHGEIDPERSVWSFASVGRISFTIAKKTNETWPKLLAGKIKPKNMHTWYDRQVALDEEAKKEKEAAKKEAKKKAEAAEAKAKAEAPPPPTTSEAAAATPTPPAPPDDGSPPPPPPPLDAAAPKKKGAAKKKAKGDGKKKKGAKKAKKEEL